MVCQATIVTLISRTTVTMTRRLSENACLAVIGAARQEMGGFYAGVMAIYSTMLAWAVATLFYQIAEGHNILCWIVQISTTQLGYWPKTGTAGRRMNLSG
jgi:hypothetical protein